MNVLVTGGTGFVGQNVVRELCRTGHHVRILVRHKASRNALELTAHCGVEVCAGTVLDEAALHRACSGIQGVIHLVGIISEVGSQTFERVHVAGTRNMLRAAQASGVKRFLHMSALGTRANAVSRYHKSKYAAEQLVRASRLDWTIFRPSIIYGPGDGFVSLFSGIIRHSPIVPIVGNPAVKFQPIHVDDVATAFARAIEEPQSSGQVLELCGPDTLSLMEIVAIIMRAMGRHRICLRIPQTVARFQARIMEIVYPFLFGKAPVLNRDQLLMLQEDNVGTGEPPLWRDLFGITPKRFRESVSP